MGDLRQVSLHLFTAIEIAMLPYALCRTGIAVEHLLGGA